MENRNAMAPEPSPANLKSKVFRIGKTSFRSMDELVTTSGDLSGLSYGMFFCTAGENQWGLLDVVDGKPKTSILLMEVEIPSVRPVKQPGKCADGYIVRYRKHAPEDFTEKYISNDRLKKSGLPEYFSLLPPSSKKYADLCDRLIRTLILMRAEECNPRDIIECGLLHGWRPLQGGKARYEADNCYPKEVHSVLPRSIQTFKKPRGSGTPEHLAVVLKAIHNVFEAGTDIRCCHLLHIAGYHESLAHQYGTDDTILPVIVPNETMPPMRIVTLVGNYSASENYAVSLCGEIVALKEAVQDRNDAVLPVIDEGNKTDSQRRKTGIEILESVVVSSHASNHFLPVLISKHAVTEVNAELCCPLVLGEHTFSVEDCHFRRYLSSLDAEFIEFVERNYAKYDELYRYTHYEVSQSVPTGIPPNRRSAYINLITAARCYDKALHPLYGSETEDFVTAWLCREVSEICNENEDSLLSSFGEILNTEITSGRFRFIQRKKYIIFDKGTDSVIVDEENVYFETDVIKALAEDKMDLCSVNALTDVMKETEVLAINDHNSKCYRFHVQSSSGTPYLLYTYGISKKLINAENRRMLDLADKADFLLDRSDFDSPTILPLGMISAGRYIGKGITFGSKSNNHVFVTGQIGNGKTFYVTNLLPSIAMLGGNAIVIDISKSFTKDQILRAVPQRIVDTLFDFVDVGKGRKKLPVNLLYIGDCVGLPAKKRRIVGFVKAAASKLSTENARLVAGLVSERLKDHDEITAFTPEMLRSTLKEGGKAGHNALGLISSVLDDLEAIDCENQGWDEFFSHSKRIPVILLHDADSANVHPLVDTLLQSAFEWQRDHATKPLTVTIDEIKDQSFADGSPLHTILSQGRKFGMRLIGITQDYISNSSHSIDVMKQAGIKILFKPVKSRDRIAAELDYRNAVDAGFGSMKIGEFIVSCDLYNKEEGVNEPVIIPAKTVRFTESPLYDRFRKEYGLVSEQEQLPTET